MRSVEITPQARTSRGLPVDSCIRLATAHDAKWLDWLQDRPFARDAGWLPMVAIRGRIRLDQIFVIEKNATPAGFVIAANRKDGLTHITQTVIDEECWREGLGAALVERVVESARLAGSHSLTLRCARDSIATPFWPHAGLTAFATQAGQRRWLTCWSRVVGSSGRLSLPPASRRAMRFSELLATSATPRG